MRSKLTGLKHLLFTAAVMATLALAAGATSRSRRSEHSSERRGSMLRKIMYSLGAMAALAMAVGAGFKPF